ncbi:MAG: hypothetical protein SPI63_03160 [Bulleidia sp.]|nr:hypothetical protein [Bulleidia sp.]
MKKKSIDYVVIVLFTVLLMYPYLFHSTLTIEHDTFFHVSRIFHYAESLQNGKFLPAIYPTENGEYGYGSPLFYCDLFLLIPAIFHNLGVSLVHCYKATVLVASLLAGSAMYLLASRFTKKSSIRLFAVCAYMFSNYHITDIYVRGTLGEVFALIGIPLILRGLYDILEQHKHWSYMYLLGLVVTVLSHILSFLLCVVLIIIFSLLYLTRSSFNTYKTLIIESMLACSLTTFYTFPMIEQLLSQKYYLSYYASSLQLDTYAMTFWQYLANRTIFGISSNQLPIDHVMVVNVGWFLTFVPIYYLFIRRKDPHFFIDCLFVIGIVCFIFPSVLLPWKQLSVLRILQFPWRFNMLALPLLCIPVIKVIEYISHRYRHVSLI